MRSLATFKERLPCNGEHVDLRCATRERGWIEGGREEMRTTQRKRRGKSVCVRERGGGESESESERAREREKKSGGRERERAAVVKRPLPLSSGHRSNLIK